MQRVVLLEPAQGAHHELVVHLKRANSHRAVLTFGCIHSCALDIGLAAYHENAGVIRMPASCSQYLSCGHFALSYFNWHILME